MNIRNILNFLDFYRQHECLWNPRSEGYKNNIVQDKAYKEISKEFHCSKLEIRLKIKSIRTVYRKELSILEKYSNQGKIYKPKLIWFEKAHQFLQNVTYKRRRRRKNEKSYLIDEINNFTDSNSNFSLNISKTENIYDDNDAEKKESYILENENVLNQNNEEYGSSYIPENKNVSDKNAEEYESFGRSIAMQLLGIKDSYSRSVAKLKIQNILFEASTGQYVQ